VHNWHKFPSGCTWGKVPWGRKPTIGFLNRHDNHVDVVHWAQAVCKGGCPAPPPPPLSSPSPPETSPPPSTPPPCEGTSPYYFSQGYNAGCDETCSAHGLTCSMTPFYSMTGHGCAEAYDGATCNNGNSNTVWSDYWRTGKGDGDGSGCGDPLGCPTLGNLQGQYSPCYMYSNRLWFSVDGNPGSTLADQSSDYLECSSAQSSGNYLICYCE